jgi:hypothetical protein
MVFIQEEEVQLKSFLDLSRVTRLKPIEDGDLREIAEHQTNACMWSGKDLVDPTG